MRFWDSSAIVPLLVAEPARESVLARLVEDPEMVVWWGTPVECASALARREREGLLSASDATRALDRLRELSLAWNEVLPSEAVRGTAQRLLRVHPLRAGDALQLAAAVIACEHEPLSFAFMSLDERLNEAAQREGFRLAEG
ncbi:MAG: type II toxin-antitoxin system VapC family toxin [Gammaproteobacteria bacterium]|nr:type II toxin-antitoxin system VapC family toxin [Gammaproteobacteria bacterium]